jgi:hypothetical protein
MMVEQNNKRGKEKGEGKIEGKKKKGRDNSLHLYHSKDTCFFFGAICGSDTKVEL